jgi:hypothetical protein
MTWIWRFPCTIHGMTTSATRVAVSALGAHAALLGMDEAGSNPRLSYAIGRATTGTSTPLSHVATSKGGSESKKLGA